MIGMSGTLPNKSYSMTVFCDFDGPLVDVSNRYYSTYRLALAKVHRSDIAADVPLTPLSKEEFWQMKQERTPDIEIAKRSRLPIDSIDPFLTEVINLVNHPDLLHQDVIQPGATWALNLLHSQGTQLVLVTLRDQEQARQILQTAKLAHLFSGIYGANNGIEVAYQNSIELKTQLLRQAAAQHWPELVRRHHPAWVIGDTEADVWSGRNLDIPTIALTCGIRSHSYLEKQSPTVILADLVSASNHLVRSPVSCA
jgi:phosphoglycolate phosphatase-like HAD superfamily hydrolase